MENVQASLIKKPFRVFDLIIYAVMIAAIVCLFVFLKPQTGKNAEVLYKGERVMLVDFDKKECKTYSGMVEKTGENVYKVTTDKGYNEITINFDEKKVIVSDADCGGECKTMSLSGGAIICVPHSLVIKYVGDELSPKVG